MTDASTFQTLTAILERMNLDERRVLAAAFTLDTLGRQTLAGRADYTPADIARCFAIFDNLRTLSPSIDGSAQYRRNGAEHKKVAPEVQPDAAANTALTLSEVLANADRADAEAESA